MQMFVLLGEADYEGCTLLGVYASRDEAEAAYEVYTQTRMSFDRCRVEQVEVGAVAEARW